jgi:hypothetical protein
MYSKEELAMIEIVVEIVIISLVGSLGVPALVLVLARFGYFPPIVIESFGRRWKFAPNPPRYAESQSNTSVADNIFQTLTATTVAATIVY